MAHPRITNLEKLLKFSPGQALAVCSGKSAARQNWLNLGEGEESDNFSA